MAEISSGKIRALSCVLEISIEFIIIFRPTRTEVAYGLNCRGSSQGASGVASLKLDPFISDFNVELRETISGFPMDWDKIEVRLKIPGLFLNIQNAFVSRYIQLFIHINNNIMLGSKILIFLGIQK